MRHFFIYKHMKFSDQARLFLTYQEFQAAIDDIGNKKALHFGIVADTLKNSFQ